MKTNKRTSRIVVAFFVGLVALASTAYAQPAVYLHLLPTSCRLLDTRVTSDHIAVNEIRVFSVDPAFSLSQGGVTDCGIPTTATGIAGVKLNIKGRAMVVPSGGNFRIFNADGSALGNYTTLQLQGAANYIAVQADIPITGNQLVAIHANVEAIGIADLIGWYTTSP